MGLAAPLSPAPAPAAEAPAAAARPGPVPAPARPAAGGPASAIFEGVVHHRRYAPIGHGFRYRIFLPLFDLGELPGLLDRIPLWSARGRAPARFRRSDYLGDPEVPLDVAARDLVAAELGRRPDGPVRLLANPRYWGVGFNPVAFYYLHGAGPGAPVEAVIASVTNTPWGERRDYVLDAGPGGLAGSFPKSLHVSPFMPMSQDYRWRSTEPGETLSLSISNHDADGAKVFEAGLELRRREITPQRLRRLLFSYPPMTTATLLRIYWNALKLKAKGAPYFTNPSQEGGA